MVKQSTSKAHARDPLCVLRRGMSPYRECWAEQKTLLERRLSGEIPDTLLLTEHPPVYTLGTGADPNHLLADPDELRSLGAEAVAVDRGGDVTFHGPGQLVGYPIIDLTRHGQDLGRYLRMLEEVIMAVLRRCGVPSGRVPGYTGVWTGGEKICAIGIKASRWITMHGFALNVNTDLTYFGRIIPCGIAERGVTSMAEVLGRPQDMAAIEDLVAEEFASVFGLEYTPAVVTEED